MKKLLHFIIFLAIYENYAAASSLNPQAQTFIPTTSPTSILNSSPEPLFLQESASALLRFLNAQKPLKYPHYFTQPIEKETPEDVAVRIVENVAQRATIKKIEKDLKTKNPLITEEQRLHLKSLHRILLGVHLERLYFEKNAQLQDFAPKTLNPQIDPEYTGAQSFYSPNLIGSGRGRAHQLTQQLRGKFNPYKFYPEKFGHTLPKITEKTVRFA